MHDDTGIARPGRNPRLRAGMLAAAVTGAALLLVAACSGGGSHPAGTGAATPGNLSVQLDADASGVRSHGVPDFYISHLGSALPSPGTVQEVFHGWAIPVDPSSSALKAARCMRSHGYPNWPDPTVQNGLVPNFVPAGIDVNSPHFQATAKACGAGP